MLVLIFLIFVLLILLVKIKKLIFVGLKCDVCKLLIFE